MFTDDKVANIVNSPKIVFLSTILGYQTAYAILIFASVVLEDPMTRRPSGLKGIAVPC